MGNDIYIYIFLTSVLFYLLNTEPTEEHELLLLLKDITKDDRNNTVKESTTSNVLSKDTKSVFLGRCKFEMPG